MLRATERHVIRSYSRMNYFTGFPRFMQYWDRGQGYPIARIYSFNSVQIGISNGLEDLTEGCVIWNSR